MDAAAPFVASAIHDANANASGNAEKRAPFPDRAAHFFETFRFDFVLDDGSASADGLPTPWLVEVNASPNLKPASAPQEDVLSRLCAKLADKLTDLAPPRRAPRTRRTPTPRSLGSRFATEVRSFPERMTDMDTRR